MIKHTIIKRIFKRIEKLLMCISLLSIISQLNADNVTAQSVVPKTYTVTTQTTPKNAAYLKYSTYNSYTKQYYMLRSYLEQLEKEGGGTLIIKAGTYPITNTLYIPSHVTIYLEDGVTLKKSDKTNTTNLAPSTAIFQFVAPTKSRVTGVYGGYKGETDIKIIGKGKATIDLNFVKNSLGMILAHNTNIFISGITFQNMQGGHFIELDASQNVSIENNSFLHHKESETKIKEAINLDTPDKTTGGLHVIWTNYDRTPNKDILIHNNTFDDLERAIGTHKYSQDKYHQNIQILNNQISNTDSDAIRILNWSNPVIKGNTIKNVSFLGNNKRAILASGVINPTIMNNTFINAPRPIQIMPWKNSDGGSQYPITYNQLTSTNITQMLQNTLINISERFIRINHKYNTYTTDTTKYYYTN